MAQPSLRPTSSRTRLGRSGLVASRSGERIHASVGSENSHLASSTAVSRSKASRTGNTTSASTAGKPVVATDRRRAFGDKTNVQSNASSQQQGQGLRKGEPPMKHKAPSTVSLLNTTSAPSRRDNTNASRTAHNGEPFASSSSNTTNHGSAIRQPSSSQPTSTASNMARMAIGQHARASSADVKMEGDSSSQRASVASTASSATLAPRRGLQHQSRRAMQLTQRSMESDEAGRAPGMTDSQHGLPQELKLGLPEAALRQPSPSVTADDDDMSKVDSTDWRSSSGEVMSRPMSSCKTETEEEEEPSDAKAAGLMSSDEELCGADQDEADETEMSDDDDESVLLNDLDPECLVSLPPELEELARNKAAHICARFEEGQLRPAAERQGLERQAALQRGEITPEVAAHDDELQLMGLDPDEVRDTSMVAEYAEEIFQYMSKCESRTMANPNYMDFQGEIRWHMRATLVDWLMQVHMRYHMMPETLWIAINVVDRFLSARVVSLAKLQLVGVTAMFIAAKYEEIMSPVVDEFVFMTESGYTRDEILKGERIILSTLDFNISAYCSPYSWVRRISKADDYDIQTRTLAKFLMELTLFDHRFLRVKPSQIAAIGMYLSKKMLGGQWGDGFVYYSSFVEEQLIPGANLLLERLVDDSFLDCFVCKKYGNRKFLKASIYARDWALRNQESMLVASNSQGSIHVPLSNSSDSNGSGGVEAAVPTAAHAFHALGSGPSAAAAAAARA